ncbi:hypothetical protein ES703_51655 [subsurface metagenome]
MAVIKVMPSEAIISGFKGTLDFYYNMGLACVRRWPRSPGHLRTQAVMSTWSAFGYASGEWKNLSPEVQAAYNKMSSGSGLTGKDLFQRAYLKGIFQYPMP